MKSASNLVLSLKRMVAKESIQELKFNPGSTVVFHELQYRLALCILCTIGIDINESSLCITRGEYSSEISSTAEGPTALTLS